VNVPQSCRIQDALQLENTDDACVTQPGIRSVKTTSRTHDHRSVICGAHFYGLALHSPGANRRAASACLADAFNMPCARAGPSGTEDRQAPYRLSCPHAAGIGELAVIGVVAEQKRPNMRPRSFGIGPADDNELLPVQRFGFAPQPAVSRRIRRVDRFRDHALKNRACRRASG
jgi:hypothetical protein